MIYELRNYTAQPGACATCSPGSKTTPIASGLGTASARPGFGRRSWVRLKG